MSCTVPECGRPARLLPRGFRCDDHRDPVPTPDPTLTAAAVRARTDYPRPTARVYGPPPDPAKGCCTCCAGAGADMSCGGPCWDCRGTGCAHPPPLCKTEEKENHA